VRQGSLRTRSIIFPPCAPQPHTALDRGRRRHPGPLTHRRSGLLPRCRSASSPSSLRWGPSRSTRRSFLYRLRTHQARQPRLRLRRCCADLRRVPPDRFRSAHPDTRSPQVTAVLGRVAATTPRARRLTTRSTLLQPRRARALHRGTHSRFGGALLNGRRTTRGRRGNSQRPHLAGRTPKMSQQRLGVAHDRSA
jgi:hypothetical protein